MILYLSFDLVVEQKICAGWIYRRFLAWVSVILQALRHLVLEKVSRVQIQRGRTFLRVRGCLQLCRRSECIAGSIVIQGKTFLRESSKIRLSFQCIFLETKRFFFHISHQHWLIDILLRNIGPIQSNFHLIWWLIIYI